LCDQLIKGRAGFIGAQAARRPLAFDFALPVAVDRYQRICVGAGCR